VRNCYLCDYPTGRWLTRAFVMSSPMLNMCDDHGAPLYLSFARALLFGTMLTIWYRCSACVDLVRAVLSPTPSRAVSSALRRCARLSRVGCVLTRPSSFLSDPLSDVIDRRIRKLCVPQLRFLCGRRRACERRVYSRIVFDMWYADPDDLQRAPVFRQCVSFLVFFSLRLAFGLRVIG
jgi:hypothetical protein